jgi:hypothetical protein
MSWAVSNEDIFLNLDYVNWLHMFIVCILYLVSPSFHFVFIDIVDDVSAHCSLEASLQGNV